MAPLCTTEPRKPIHCYGASRKRISSNMLISVSVITATSPCGPSPSCLLKGDFDLRVAPSTSGFQVHSVLSACGKPQANNPVLHSVGGRLIVQGNTHPVFVAHLDRRGNLGLAL